jgi:hypothetical protein
MIFQDRIHPTSSIDDVERLYPRSVRSGQTLVVPKLFVVSEVVAIDAEFRFRNKTICSIGLRPALRRASCNWTAHRKQALHYLKRIFELDELSGASETVRVAGFCCSVEDEWGDFEVLLNVAEESNSRESLSV